MSWITQLGLTLLCLALAVQQLRRNRRLGRETQWRKLFVTLVGCLVICAVGLGCLAVLVERGETGLGYIAFAIVFGVGMGLLARGVNRRWPQTAPSNKPPPEHDKARANDNTPK